MQLRSDPSHPETRPRRVCRDPYVRPQAHGGRNALNLVRPRKVRRNARLSADYFEFVGLKLFVGNEGRADSSGRLPARFAAQSGTVVGGAMLSTRMPNMW